MGPAGVGQDVLDRQVAVDGRGAPAGDAAVQEREERFEGVQIVGVYARDVRVGDDDEGQIAQGAHAVGEAHGDERGGEAGGGK